MPTYRIDDQGHSGDPEDSLTDETQAGQDVDTPARSQTFEPEGYPDESIYDDYDDLDYDDSPDDLESDFDDPPDTTTEPDEPDEPRLPQSKVDEILNKHTAKERSRFEKQLREKFGTTNLDEIEQYYQAGYGVATTSGQNPSQVVERLTRQWGYQPRLNNPAGAPPPAGQHQHQQQQQPGAFGAPPPVGQNDDIMSEVQKLRELVEGEKVAEARRQQESQARKEFGADLYDEHVTDIREYAQEKDLSLVEAAAVILHPHVIEKTREREKNKQETRKRRSVDAGDTTATAEPVDYGRALGPDLRRMAREFGISYKKLYERRKAAGKIE